MKILIMAAAVLLAVVAATPAHADTFVAGGYYIGESNGEISLVNTATGTNSVIYSSGIAWYDIAWSPTGTLYGITSSGGLYSISLSGQSETLIGSSKMENVGLDFDAGGTLYAAKSSLWTLSLGDGSATLVGAMGHTAQGDIAFDAGGTLYMSTTSHRLVTVSTADGSTTDVGAIGFSSVTGIDFVGSDLIGANLAGSIFDINTGTGAGALLSTLNPLGTTYGSSTAPGAVIPEPGTLALLGLGVGLLALGRRRRKAA